MAFSTNNDEKDGGGGGNFIPGERSVLQKHVAFFDRNGDGVIYPWETFLGFHAIGCGVFLSIVGSMFIHVALSGKTRPGKFTHLLFPIEIQNIHLGRHGSDTGVYDSEGKFVATKFEEIFTKYSRTITGALTSQELMKMLQNNREPKDYVGWFFSWTEWKTLYFLCKDSNGMLNKDTMRAAYDGSLFEWLEKDVLAKKKAAM